MKERLTRSRTLHDGLAGIISYGRAWGKFCNASHIPDDATEIIYGPGIVGVEHLKDRSYVLSAVKEFPAGFRKLPLKSPFRADREIALEAIRHSHNAFCQADRELQKDPLFIAEAFEINPNIQIHDKTPAVERQRAYESWIYKLKRHGISFPGRFNSTIAAEIINNLEHIQYPDDRPAAIFLYPQIDKTAAFEDNNHFFEFIQRGYRVYYFEIGHTHDLIQARAHLLKLIDASGKAHFAPFLNLGSHSTIVDCAFGDPNPESDVPLDPNLNLLITDLTQGIAGEIAKLQDVLAKDCDISIEGCGAGGGRTEILNVANAVRLLFPRAGKIFSSTVPMFVVKYLFDMKNRPTGVIYSRKNAEYMA